MCDRCSWAKPIISQILGGAKAFLKCIYVNFTFILSIIYYFSFSFDISSMFLCVTFSSLFCFRNFYSMLSPLYFVVFYSNAIASAAEYITSFRLVKLRSMAFVLLMIDLSAILIIFNIFIGFDSTFSFLTFYSHIFILLLFAFIPWTFSFSVLFLHILIGFLFLFFLDHFKHIFIGL